MKITTELYNDSIARLPKTGQHILAHQTANEIIVYQAYKQAIANFAIENQYLGGPDFSLNRMSWIKPNFLWMMYRCGWAEKENQERVLAIRIAKKDFENVLRQAAFSSFDAKYYASHDAWKSELNTKDVRLQWDPDHDPYGNKLERRAIQLGLKGESLKTFIQQIISVDDITEFVKEQKRLLDSDNLGALMVPIETVFEISDRALGKRIGLD